MPRRRSPKRERDWLFPGLTVDADLPQGSLLDIVDGVLNRGVVLDGDVMLGVANVDLIYARLSVLLAALDRVAEAQVAQSRQPAPKKRKPR